MAGGGGIERRRYSEPVASAARMSPSCLSVVWEECRAMRGTLPCPRLPDCSLSHRHEARGHSAHHGLGNAATPSITSHPPSPSVLRKRMPAGDEKAVTPKMPCLCLSCQPAHSSTGSRHAPRPARRSRCAVVGRLVEKYVAKRSVGDIAASAPSE